MRYDSLQVVWVVCLVVLTTCMEAALAQSTIDPAHKFSWQENTGWMNWHDAGTPDGAQGVVVPQTFLSGFIWGENIGYINTGDGSPTNGTTYANLTGADHGVNLDPATGFLSGLAWGENVGWINFGPLLSLPVAQRPRLDAAADRLRGYAWGENIGWLNLDDATHFVAVIPPCPPDWNNDGAVNSNDYFAFLDDFFGAGGADFNNDGTTNSDDYFAFLAAFFEGC